MVLEQLSAKATTQLETERGGAPGTPGVVGAAWADAGAPCNGGLWHRREEPGKTSSQELCKELTSWLIRVPGIPFWLGTLLLGRSHWCYMVGVIKKKKLITFFWENMYVG